MFKVILSTIFGAILTIIVGVSTNILTPITDEFLKSKDIVNETNNSKSNPKKIKNIFEPKIAHSSRVIIKPLNKKNDNTISNSKKVKKQSKTKIKKKLKPKVVHSTKKIKTYKTKKYKKVYLTISGMGAEVTIKKSPSKLPYAGGTISAMGADQVIFLPKNQALSVTLSGMGAKLNIAKSIAYQVTVNNSGGGAKVSIF